MQIDHCALVSPCGLSGAISANRKDALIRRKQGLGGRGSIVKGRWSDE